MARWKLTTDQLINLGTDMMNAIGTEVKLPWERYPHREDPPPGFDEWDENAREEWWNEQARTAGRAAIRWLEENLPGPKEWRP